MDCQRCLMELDISTYLCEMVDTISDTTSHSCHYEPISPVSPRYTIQYVSYIPNMAIPSGHQLKWSSWNSRHHLLSWRKVRSTPSIRRCLRCVCSHHVCGNRRLSGP